MLDAGRMIFQMFQSFLQIENAGALEAQGFVVLLLLEDRTPTGRRLMEGLSTVASSGSATDPIVLSKLKGGAGKAYDGGFFHHLDLRGLG